MKKVTVACFSPTGNSKKYASLLAEKIDKNFDILDFTKKENRKNDIVFCNIFSTSLCGQITQYSFV